MINKTSQNDRLQLMLTECVYYTERKNMTTRFKGKSTIGELIQTVVGSLIFIIIMIILMEWLRVSGYIEKAIIKIIKEIPFGMFLGKWAEIAIGKSIDALKDMVYYGSVTKMTFGYFATNLLKLIISGLIFKVADTIIETVLGIKNRWDAISCIRKGFIKFCCALFSAWIAALVYNTIKNIIEIMGRGYFPMLTDGYRVGISLGAVILGAVVILILFLSPYILYGGFTLKVFLGFILGKMIIVNSLSILGTFAITLIVLLGFEMRVNSILGFFPLIVLGIFLLSLLEYGLNLFLSS